MAPADERLRRLRETRGPFRYADPVAARYIREAKHDPDALAVLKAARAAGRPVTFTTTRWHLGVDPFEPEPSATPAGANLAAVNPLNSPAILGIEWGTESPRSPWRRGTLIDLRPLERRPVIAAHELGHHLHELEVERGGERAVQEWLAGGGENVADMIARNRERPLMDIDEPRAQPVLAQQQRIADDIMRRYQKYRRPPENWLGWLGLAQARGPEFEQLASELAPETYTAKDVGRMITGMED